MVKVSVTYKGRWHSTLIQNKKGESVILYRGKSTVVNINREIYLNLKKTDNFDIPKIYDFYFFFMR